MPSDNARTRQNLLHSWSALELWHFSRSYFHPIPVSNLKLLLNSEIRSLRSRKFESLLILAAAIHLFVRCAVSEVDTNLGERGHHRIPKRSQTLANWLNEKDGEVANSVMLRECYSLKLLLNTANGFGGRDRGIFAGLLHQN